MSNKFPGEGLLIKAIADLHDFLPYLVLVGGWVPYLYAAYIWPQKLRLLSRTPVSGPPLITTTDMDFGVMIVSYDGSESIADRVQKLGYGERHVSMDRLFPFVPVIKSRGGDEKIEVEFITIVDPPENIKEKLVGKEIKLNTLPYFDILLESPVKVEVFSHKVQIPTEAVFIFHKLLTFIERINKEKFKKDLYYVYYMLRFNPNRVETEAVIRTLVKNKKEGRLVIENIKKYFADENDQGPVLIEQENGIDRYINNVRQDAYERIVKLLS